MAESQNLCCFEFLNQRKKEKMIVKLTAKRNKREVLWKYYSRHLPTSHSC